MQTLFPWNHPVVAFRHIWLVPLCVGTFSRAI